jgi:hypothetical protein
MNQQILELKFKLDSSKYYVSRFEMLVKFWLLLRGVIHSKWSEQGLGNRNIVDGLTFIQSVLPFSTPFFLSENARVGLVPPHEVLAGKYRGYSFPLEPRELCDRLDSYAATLHSETALYTKIEPFNVYVAHEGKNRTDVYRKLNRQVRAFIYKTDYPKSHELELVRLIPFGGVGLRYKGSNSLIVRSVRKWQLIGTSNRGPLAILGFKESVDILEAYGVKFGDCCFTFRAKFLAAKVRLIVTHNCYMP